MAFGVKNVISILLVVCAASTANSSNILGYSSTPSRSHYIVHETFLKGLAAKGHNVSEIENIVIRQYKCHISDLYR